MSKKIAVLISGPYGYEMARYLKKIKKRIDLLIIDKNQNKIEKKRILNLELSNKVFYASSIFPQKLIKEIKISKIKLILSFWWPYILKEKYIKLTPFGILNPHSGFLPYERGVHSYVYSILNNNPKGVTLHFMEKDVDCGKIFKQKKIKTNEFITASELEIKIRKELIKFYKKNISTLLKLDFDKKTMKFATNKSIQNLRKNLDKNTKFSLNKKYKAIDLIRLFLSRSGFKDGGANFKYRNNYYEVDLKIRKKEK